MTPLGTHQMTIQMLNPFGARRLAPVLFSMLLAGPMRVGAQLPVFHNAGSPWVDSVLAQLTLEEKIGQLFMIPSYSNRDAAHENAVAESIRKHHVGGIIFMQGGPARQAQLVNRFQSEAKVPLLMAQDAEWGLGMRLDSTESFPRQMMWGALDDHELVYELGRELGRQCARVGVNMNFAPVVDVNNNARNPVINDRAFSENRHNVALRGLQYTKGMQDVGILASAKHFPGHGDTDKDSHYDLPVIMHDRERLDSVEMYPYRVMIPQGVAAVMTAHLNVPALDNTTGAVASLSGKVVNDLLRNELGFRGLVVTDALNMKGVAAFGTGGEAELRAVLAGNDILLFPSNMSRSVDLIKAAIRTGKYSEAQLDESVRRILHAKYWAGLNRFRPVVIAGIHEDLNNLNVEALQRRLIANALTVASNEDSVIPIKSVIGRRIALVNIGLTGPDAMGAAMSKYASIETFDCGKDDLKVFTDLLKKLKQYDLVIVGVHGMSRYASRGFGVTLNTKFFVQELHKQNKVILAVFGNPYSLEYFDYARNVIVAYEDTRLTSELTGQLIFGGIPARGKLPVTAGKFAYGDGFRMESASRLRYGTPEEVGISSASLDRIGLIAEEMILKQAAPGANVLVAKDGRVIYHKSFGHHTYDRTMPQTVNDIYDLASITKVAAMTLAVMKLYEEGKLNLDSSFSSYLTEMKGTAVGAVTLRNALTHTAGLKAWIPFYESTTNDSVFGAVYSDSLGGSFCVPVAECLYMREDWVDTLYNRIGRSALKNPGTYRYSDLAFYLLKKVVEEITRSSMETYLAQNFYKPLGLQTMGFNPAERFPATRLVPSENDDYYRRQVLRGHVHDMGAAMMGGVSGHAGLFSDANDLAIIFQMMLNGGTYGGKRYLKKETVDYFTKRQTTKARRGLGFDKPEPNPRNQGPTSTKVSLKTYGHSGFTGTCVWVDPEQNLIYIFLSNRTYPTMDNRKLITESIRTRVQDVIYEAIASGNQTELPMVNVPANGKPTISKP